MKICLQDEQRVNLYLFSRLFFICRILVRCFFLGGGTWFFQVYLMSSAESEQCEGPYPCVKQYWPTNPTSEFWHGHFRKGNFVSKCTCWWSLEGGCWRGQMGVVRWVVDRGVWVVDGWQRLSTGTYNIWPPKASPAACYGGCSFGPTSTKILGLPGRVKCLSCKFPVNFPLNFLCEFLVNFAWIFWPSKIATPITKTHRLFIVFRVQKNSRRSSLNFSRRP